MELQLEKFPAVLADHAAPDRSSKYLFVPTHEIVKIMEGIGWAPVNVSQRRSRDVEMAMFQEHLVQFRNPELPMIAGTALPQLTLVNSHNGKKRYLFLFGLWAVACSNGLLVSSGTVTGAICTHIRSHEQAIKESVTHILDEVPRVTKLVKGFMHTSLDEGQQQEFAIMMSQARFGDENINIEEALVPVFSQYKKPTLWNIFNTLQNKFMYGADAVRLNSQGRPVALRGVRGVRGYIRKNTALWEVLESYYAKTLG